MTKRLTAVLIAVFIFMVFCFVVGEYLEHKKLASYSSSHSEELFKALTEELQNKMNNPFEPNTEEKGD